MVTWDAPTSQPLRDHVGVLALGRDLRRSGHHLVILTTKPHFSIHDTYDWLARHRIPSTEVHILDDKTQVACVVYLDDADHNLASLVAGHPGATVCRYVRPWNNAVAGALDVEGWREFAVAVASRTLNR